MIQFYKPYFTGKEIANIVRVLKTRKLAGDNTFTKKCVELMKERFRARNIYFTTSCTHALEMSALLLDLKKDDEIIMPSFTFVSTANAFLLRGAKPIFVDIRKDTFNIDEKKIEEKITSKTKAIVPVHYAGVSCEMDKIMRISKKYGIKVVEDAAQGVNAQYKNKYLGTIGDLGCYSFHESKNYVCGEGGALLVNNSIYKKRAEIIREKGTNRSQFLNGEIDKYTWVDIGSSYLPSDILAAILYPQLEEKDKILNERKNIYDFYYDGLRDYNEIRLPHIPKGCISNYHLFTFLTKNIKERNNLLKFLRQKGISASFHYQPLHLSPMGKNLGYTSYEFPITKDIATRIIRLPLYVGLEREIQIKIIDFIKKFYSKIC